MAFYGEAKRCAASLSLTLILVLGAAPLAQSAPTVVMAAQEEEAPQDGLTLPEFLEGIMGLIERYAQKDQEQNPKDGPGNPEDPENPEEPETSPDDEPWQPAPPMEDKRYDDIAPPVII